VIPDIDTDDNCGEMGQQHALTARVQRFRFTPTRPLIFELRSRAYSAACRPADLGKSTTTVSKSEFNAFEMIGSSGGFFDGSYQGFVLLTLS
jgi:hypothetical protein